MKGIHSKGEILVICNPEDGDNDHSLQIVSKAKELSRHRDKKVSSFYAGSFDMNWMHEVISYGANSFILWEQYRKINTLDVCDCLTYMIKKRDVEYILVPDSEFGKQIAMVLSIRFQAGLIADCIQIELDERGNCLFFKYAQNDTMIAKMQHIKCKYKISTLKKEAKTIARNRQSKKGKIESIVFPIKRRNDINYEVLEVVSK